jgi:hypothetical protein
MQSVYIHCGLHKTGTTAIQRVFADHQHVLRANGLLYPRPDRFGGHHNLAWALTQDRRFRPAGLTWPKVINEIAAFDGDALLSSEDFESILHRPDRLSQLMENFRGIGRDVCLVIYIRKRAQYIESLYLELLKHGYAASFGAYQREIQQTGRLNFREWTYQFDLDRVWSVLSSVPGLRFVRRDYPESRGASAAADFLAVLGLSSHLLGQSVLSRVNQRHATAISLSQFMFNRVGRPLSAEESAVIAMLCPRKFVQWSAGSPERPDHEAGAASSHYLNRVFSSRTVETIRQLASAAGAPNLDKKRRQLAAWWQGGAPVAADTFWAFQYTATLANLPTFRILRGNARGDDPEDPLWHRRVAALPRTG